MDPFKKLEAKIFNLELHILDLKYSSTGKEKDKGRLVDSLFVTNNTSLTHQSLIQAIKSRRIQAYFFEDDLHELFIPELSIPTPQNEMENA